MIHLKALDYLALDEIKRKNFQKHGKYVHKTAILLVLKNIFLDNVIGKYALFMNI